MNLLFYISATVDHKHGQREYAHGYSDQSLKKKKIIGNAIWGLYKKVIDYTENNTQNPDDDTKISFFEKFDGSVEI